MSSNSTSDDGSNNQQGIDTGLVLSIVALIISVVALIGTILQVTQQYYASAAGYSNVGEQVMSDWHKTKRRKFLVSEFRFEVLFETPVIFICPPTNKRGPLGVDSEKKIVFITGEEESLRNLRIPDPMVKQMKSAHAMKEQAIHTADNELATWVTLLGALHKMEKASQTWQAQQLLKEQQESAPSAEVEKQDPLAAWGDHTMTVALQAKGRTYDNQPEGVKKPYATTTIGHMVEMAAFLGLYWKLFDREKNKYHAEGSGYVLSGREVDELGVMFHFQISGITDRYEHRVIPVLEVKELAFGFVSTLFRKHLGESREMDFDHENQRDSNVLQFGSPVETAETLTHFGCNSRTAGYFKDASKKHSHIFPVPFEIVGMLARSMYIPNTYFRRLPNPTSFRWNKKDFSILKLILEYNKMLVDSEFAVASEQVAALQSWGDQVEDGLKSRHRGEEHFPLSLLSALYEAIIHCDKFLIDEANRPLVVLVVREHVQHVMRLLNEIDPDGETLTSPVSASQPSRTSTGFSQIAEEPLKRRSTFDELNSAGPEEKQSKFMDIYFSVVLGRVMESSREVLRKKKSTFYVHSRTSSSASSIVHEAPKPGDDDIKAAEAGQDEKKDTSPPKSLGRTVSFSEKVSTIKPSLPSGPSLRIHKPSDEDRSKSRGVDDMHDEKVSDIWCTLVFRMLCWLMLHDFDKKDVQISKSELFGSREPVYIG